MACSAGLVLWCALHSNQEIPGSFSNGLSTVYDSKPTGRVLIPLVADLGTNAFPVPMEGMGWNHPCFIALCTVDTPTSRALAVSL